ncbi:MAG TPA: hypothetical protein PK252_02855 [Bacteroidales bacterium]|nr:hypothetical protein [Bacteroidales bacterium]
MSINNKNQIAGYVLASLMLLTLLNSAYFFLSIVKPDFFRWLAFNACSLAIIAYLTCFVCYKITKKDFFLAIAFVPMYYYGTMGLFVVSWEAANLFAQITHIIITLNAIWVLFELLKESKYDSLGKGLLIGLLVFVPVFAVIQVFSQQHMAEFIRMLQKVH